MNYNELPIVIKCDDCRLIGIVTQPERLSKLGVLILVGGPQYRSGSHRHFTLLARFLAENGVPSLRFDYRGMGDSEGEMRTFENINEDIHCAINAFYSIVDSVDSILIWGLCDAASAILYYAYTDNRVSGIILLNPWVHTEKGAQRARLKYYYFDRFLQKHFWSKLLSGKVNLITSLRDIAGSVLSMVKISNYFEYCKPNINQTKITFIDRMLDGFKQFTGNVLLILSENDLVSQEFQQLMEYDSNWKSACSSNYVEKILISNANHTFSSREWRCQVNDIIMKWINKHHKY